MILVSVCTPPLEPNERPYSVLYLTIAPHPHPHGLQLLACVSSMALGRS